MTLIPEDPIRINFTNLSINADEFFTTSKEWLGPTPQHWTKVYFTFPASNVFFSFKQPHEHVKQWLNRNCEGLWVLDCFKSNDQIMAVAAFENKTNALLFKLQGGYEAWREEQDGIQG